MKHRTTVVRSTLLAAVLVLAPSAAAGAPTASADQSPYCGIRWGSLDKQAAGLVASTVTSVRSGRHDCFDRLVVDLAGPPAGYRVGYVSSVLMDPSGMPVTLRGGARLQLVVLAPAYDSSGADTYPAGNPGELTDVSGYRTLRQAAWAGTFEGQTRIGVGVRARLPFRVFTVPGPGAGSRVVLDVAHRW